MSESVTSLQSLLGHLNRLAEYLDLILASVHASAVLNLKTWNSVILLN